MARTTSFTRREWLGTVGAAALSSRAAPEDEKAFGGVFKILATPYREDKSIDYEDLAAEVRLSSPVRNARPRLASELERSALAYERRSHGRHDGHRQSSEGHEPNASPGSAGPQHEVDARVSLVMPSSWAPMR